MTSVKYIRQHKKKNKNQKKISDSKKFRLKFVKVVLDLLNKFLLTHFS